MRLQTKLQHYSPIAKKNPEEGERNRCFTNTSWEQLPPVFISSCNKPILGFCPSFGTGGKTPFTFDGHSMLAFPSQLNREISFYQKLVFETHCW